MEHKSRKQYGLASVFSVTCAVCGTENVVKTSSEHKSGQRGPPSHDVNSRAVLGCLHTGIGENHLNDLLCTLNISSMNPVTFKSRENEIGHAVEQVTKKSCKTAMSKETKKHNCRLNHTASSRAMEPMVAVHLFTESLNSHVKLSVYIGDEDSTTAAHIKEKVPYSVEKWTDIVHAKRSLTTWLYNLSQRGKFVNSSTLSQNVINYLVKCFTYSVSQNKGNPSALQKSLQSILPHSYGNHKNCNESWCGAKKDPTNYKHSDLPYGKDLYSDDLRKALEKIFDEYCTDIVVAKLSPGANSQRNEALNSVIGSKTPKIS